MANESYRGVNKLANILAVPQPEQRSPEWYATRENFLTSSDIGTVLGHNKYQTREDVLLKKAGLKEIVIDDDTAIKHGQHYENEAIQVYCHLTGRKASEVGLVPYAALNKNTIVNGIDCSFLAGSADGVTVLENDPEGSRSLNAIEVKCPYRRWPKNGTIPHCYYGQLQMNLHILNVDVGEFIEYVPKGLRGSEGSMNVVRIYKDDLWFWHVVPKLRQFWDEVLALRSSGNVPIPKTITETKRKRRK